MLKSWTGISEKLQLINAKLKKKSNVDQTLYLETSPYKKFKLLQYVCVEEIICKKKNIDEVVSKIMMAFEKLASEG